MGKLKHLGNILASEVFQQLLCRDKLKMAEINSIMCLLVNCNIPFELTFNQGTNSSAAAFTLIIILTPTTSITRIFSLEGGLFEGGAQL
ncbi:MAG: hypothetical protein ACOWWR_14970 [Eubacteriales bacterium]